MEEGVGDTDTAAGGLWAPPHLPPQTQDTQILGGVGSPSWSAATPKIIDTNNSFTLSHFE